jgi:hypothetical protein
MHSPRGKDGTIIQKMQPIKQIKKAMDLYKSIHINV